MKNVTWELVPGPFLFSKNPLQKEFCGDQHVVLDKFQYLCYYISNISSLLQKFDFPIEVVLNSLETQKKFL